MNSNETNNIEENVWLPQSIIWTKLGDFYRHKGITAWHNSIPYQVTSNPHIAAAYGEMILAFLEDWIEQHGKFSGTCHIVEMGAGHASFSLMMLRGLEKFQQDFDALGLELSYVITDLAETNLEAWKNNPLLAPYLDSGLAQVTLFNCLEQHELWIAEKQVTSTDAPWIFIANYLFDTLPQEAFLFDGNTILRAAANVCSREPVSSSDPDKWDLRLDFKPFSIEELNTPINGLLNEYKKIGLQGCLLLPSGAIQCLEKIRNLSLDRFLLLCSDKALTTQNSVSNRTAEEITGFISVSMLVNFHALMLYFQHEGGGSWLQGTQQEFLASAAYVMGADPFRMRRTKRTFSNRLDHQSPGDLYSLSTHLLAQRFNMSIGNMISILKQMEWDPAIFESLYDALIARLPQASPGEISDLLAVLPLIANCRNFLPGSSDTLFRIAHLLQCLQRYPSAIELYLSRIEEWGESSEISYNLGLCYYAMQEIEKAKAAFTRSTVLDSNMLLAQGWLYRLQNGNH